MSSRNLPNKPDQPSHSLDSIRQQADLLTLAAARDVYFGSADQCPLAPQALAGLTANSPGVEAVVDGGLTAVVIKLRVGGTAFAIKQARGQCLVDNVDGKTSFLNEIQRHRELAAHRLRGAQLPGIVSPIYGSLRNGIIVSRWIEGSPIQCWGDRQINQLFAAGSALLNAGYFEWDFSPGNIIDDGTQIWLFDFGYLYRFDPLSQFNTAGSGTSHPQFHLGERIAARSYFSHLLDVESREGRLVAVDHYANFVRIALEHYVATRAALRTLNCTQLVFDWWSHWIAYWKHGLRTDPGKLYLADGWRAHLADLEDDLRGRSCTNRTISRADWLITQIERDSASLRATSVLNVEESKLSSGQLVEVYRCHRARAESLIRA